VYVDEAFFSKQLISYIDSVRSVPQSYERYFEYHTQLRITGLSEKAVHFDVEKLLSGQHN
jgi:hypothetical protein